MTDDTLPSVIVNMLLFVLMITMKYTDQGIVHFTMWNAVIHFSKTNSSENNCSSAIVDNMKTPVHCAFYCLQFHLFRLQKKHQVFGIWPCRFCFLLLLLLLLFFDLQSFQCFISQSQVWPWVYTDWENVTVVIQSESVLY